MKLPAAAAVGNWKVRREKTRMNSFGRRIVLMIIMDGQRPPRTMTAEDNRKTTAFVHKEFPQCPF